MSEAWRTLQQSYREVGRLYADLQPPVFARQDWDGSVYARKSLGDDVQVEIAYLAEHFLLAWNDWWGLRERYLRYFGQPADILPQTWRTLGARCQTLAYQIGRDSRLDQRISHGWQAAMSVTRLAGREELSARSVFHDLVMNHRRLMVVVVLEPPLDDLGEQAKGTPRGKGWYESPGLAWRMNQELIREWDELPSPVRDDALWFLRNYQRANLAFSWLREDAAHRDRVMPSAFVHALTSEKHVSPSIEQSVQRLKIDDEDQETVHRLLRRIEAAVGEIGYAGFVEDVSSDEFLGGDDSPIGTDRINVIPGQIQPTCRTILLAVSRGEKGAIGFPNIMKQVRGHLIRCVDKTRLVIVLCDYWRPMMLDDHIEDLRAHHERRVEFLFLMVGTPETVLAPVAVSLE